MSINITVMKDPRVKENYYNVAQSNLKENKAIGFSNAEDNKISLDNQNTAINIKDEEIIKEATSSKTGPDIKQNANKNDSHIEIDTGFERIKYEVLDKQVTDASTINTVDKDEIKPKVSTNTKFITVKTVTAINREHENDKVSNVNIQVLDKQNEIDTGYRIKRNKNSNSGNTVSNTLDKNIDVIINNESDHSIIKIEEDIIEIKEETSDKVEEYNAQVDLNNGIIKVEDDIITVDDNSSEGSGDTLRIMDIEQFDLTSDSNESVEIICENDTEENNGNLKDVINKKITETFSKIRQRNKETNFELLNCKELEEEGDQTQNIESDENTNSHETNLIEKMLHRKLNVLTESIYNMLNEDEEYVTIKSIVTDNTKSLHQSSKKNS